MKYKRKNNKNSIEIMKEEKNNLMTNDFDAEEYLDEEFLEESKRRFFNRTRKQEYEYIIDDDDEDEDEEPIKEEKKVEKKEEPKVEEKPTEDKKIDKKIVNKEKDKKPKKEKKKETKKEVKQEETPILTIEPIRTVTTEEYKDITRKRQEEKERQLKLEQEAYEKKKNKRRRKQNKSKEKVPFKLDIKKVINILFILILILVIITLVDIVCVSKYEKGPYFAINTNTYNDGGTKIYYGIGYKVIKYHQLQGRRDMEIGTWSLKYNVEPITISDIDLAIEFNNDELKTYDNYYKKFVRINSTLKKVNKKSNTITIGYEDEDGKYTMDIICKLADKDVDIDKFKEGEETTIIGVITKYTGKTSTKPTILKISNCFAEQ